mgnify:CR=1 FL=1
MEMLATVPSRKQANRIVEEVVSQGGGTITGKNAEGIIYSKFGTVTEKIYVLRPTKRQWQVVKETG